jgi:hypothetical protein
MSNDEFENSKDRIRRIVKQFAGSVSEGDDFELVPQYGIKGSGDIHCFYPNKRIFIKIARGTKIFIIEEKVNEQGRVLIYTFNGEIVEIDPEELEYIGFD